MSMRYTAVATATAGRDGRVHSDHPALDLPLAVPTEMGGPGGAGTNPEQLFAAGYAACFGSAVQAVARRTKVSARTASITAHVTLHGEGGAFRLSVELVGTFPDLPRDQAQALMDGAHALCPYSNATRGNIEVTLTVA